jgi:hypothetical protein
MTDDEHVVCLLARRNRALMERLLMLVSLSVSTNAFHIPSAPVLHRQRLVRRAFFDVELSKPMV